MRGKTCLHKGKVIALFFLHRSLACENICSSSLFAAGDVLHGGMSVTQRQKFHTDDVKSVRNPSEALIG